MTESHTCDTLRRRTHLTGNVRLKSPIHVGASDVAAIDGLAAPILRDGHARPWIPGASLRGSLRTALETLLRGLGGAGARVCESGNACEKSIDKAREVFASQRHVAESDAFDLAWRESCVVCRLFGNTHLAARVRIADLVATEPLVTTKRHGNAVNGDLRTVTHQTLYEFEAIPAGASFAFRAVLDDAADHEVGLLVEGLGMFDLGLASLGGKRARGLGDVAIDLDDVRHVTAADYFGDFDDTEGPRGTVVSIETLNAAVIDHLDSPADESH